MLHHGIRAKVNDYLGSLVGVFISMVLIIASQHGIRAKVNCDASKPGCLIDNLSTRGILVDVG